MKTEMQINNVIADCNDMRILLSKLKEEPLTYHNVALIKSFVAKYDKQLFGSVLECAQEHSIIEYLSELTHMICELFNEKIIKIRIKEYREYCEKEYGELKWGESLPSNECYNQYIRITSAINKYQKIVESLDTTYKSKRETAMAFIGRMQLDCKFDNFQKVIAICKEINMSCEIYVKDKINNKNELEVSKRKAQEKQSQEEKTTIHIGTINCCNNNNKDYILLNINEKTVNNNTQVNTAPYNTKNYAANKSEEDSPCESEEETKTNTTEPKNSDKDAKKDNKEQIPNDRKNEIELSDDDREELDHISKELHSLLCLDEKAPFARKSYKELSDYLSLKGEDYCGFVKRKQRAMTALWHIQNRLTNREWLDAIMKRIGFEEKDKQRRYDSISEEIIKIKTIKELKKTD